MEPSSINQDPREFEVIRRAGDGDTAGLEGLLERYRPRLRRMIKLRLDRRLQGRVDPSDVIQEAYVEAHYSDYARLRFGKFKAPVGLDAVTLAGKYFDGTAP